MIRWVALALLFALPARAADGGCAGAIGASEAAFRLPAGLLGSISMVESGRADARTGRPAPWPWTINVAGAGRFFETKDEAIAAVQAARAAGVQSIDVGCMQINLMHHPLAFATLEDAFDPQANASYAAGFLTRLFAQSRSWPEAAASYHSATPGLREDYQRRVMSGWPAASRFGFAPEAQPKAVASAQHTPEFRARMADQAADRSRWAAMGLVPAAPPRASVTARRSGIRLAGLRLP